MRFTTAAGMAVELHGLTSADAAAYRDHLLRLSPRDRRMRFHTALGDAAVAPHVDGLDWEHSLLFGAFVGGSMRGAGYLGADNAGRACEVALSVESDYQHAAIGKVLMAAAIIAARALACDTARLSVLCENDGMLALARAFGARMTCSSGVVEAEIPIGARWPHSETHATDLAQDLTDRANSGREKGVGGGVLGRLRTRTG